MKNIKDILWDEHCTGEEEYLIRRWFYGCLNKVCDMPSSNMSFKDEVLNRVENLTETIPDLKLQSTGSNSANIGEFGWKVGYDFSTIQYLKKGVESFKIFDN